MFITYNYTKFTKYIDILRFVFRQKCPSYFNYGYKYLSHNYTKFTKYIDILRFFLDILLLFDFYFLHFFEFFLLNNFQVFWFVDIFKLIKLVHGQYKACGIICCLLL